MRKQNYLTGSVTADGKMIPLVSAKLNIYDYLGAFMVRWGINRSKFRIKPGLYSIGRPNNISDVFVTANYKLSFDHLRKNLAGIDGWILVLDTKGINVWCAAGKGTFSTEELVNKINQVELNRIVSHKRLILPQLSATGVAAHKVKELSGFSVKYGPVRASEIKEFINAGYKATAEMRKVTFTFWERLKLTPNDFMYGKFYLLGAILAVLLLSASFGGGFSLRNTLATGAPRMLNIFLAYFSGIVITPLILPYLPFRQFSFKGFIAGLFVAIILFLLNMTGDRTFEKIAWFLFIPAISSFMAMNFTGSSTFTSLSGVRKEMRFAVPLQIISVSAGIIFFVLGLLIK